MRIFGGDRISSLMTRFNMPENTPLTHAMVSKVLEQIQIKVEGYNFDVRKNLVEYDNVINKQRSIVYALRDQTLRNEKTHPRRNQKQVFGYLKKQIESLIALNLREDAQKLDAQKAVLEFSEILPLAELGRQQLTADLVKADQPDKFLLNILKKQWKQRVAYFGQEIGNNILSYTIITSLDPLWVDHLTALDNLRQSIGLQSYAQKDPLIEYRKAGYDMFQSLMGKFEYNLARKLFRLEPAQSAQNIAPANATEERGQIIAPKPTADGATSTPASPQTSTTGHVVKPVTSSANTPGRNDPCPCGSGKKYKKCCYPKFG